MTFSSSVFFPPATENIQFYCILLQTILAIIQTPQKIGWFWKTEGNFGPSIQCVFH
jgi:hypothetical protein